MQLENLVEFVLKVNSQIHQKLLFIQGLGLISREILIEICPVFEDKTDFNIFQFSAVLSPLIQSLPQAIRGQFILTRVIFKCHMKDFIILKLNVVN